MIDVVILGGGHMGALHARAFAEAAPRAARVVGVYDVDAAVARKLAAARDVRAFETLADALGAAELVVVAAPTDAHRPLAQAALFAGRAVLIEKPACATAADAAALRAAEQRAKVPVFVGHSERFNPVVLGLRERLAGRALQRLRCERFGTATRAKEHVLLNLAVHDLDLAAVLAPGPLMVRHARGDHGAVELVLDRPGFELEVSASQRANERRRTIAAASDGERFEGDLLAQTLAVGGVAVPLSTGEPLVLQARAVLAALGAPVESEAAPAALADGLLAIDRALAATKGTVSTLSTFGA